MASAGYWDSAVKNVLFDEVTGAPDPKLVEEMVSNASCAARFRVLTLQAYELLLQACEANSVSAVKELLTTDGIHFNHSYYCHVVSSTRSP